MFGWSGKILRIDLTEHKASIEPTQLYSERFIGGRGINLKVIFDEVDPHTKPFDPENRLLFGPGVLGGTCAPTASRMQVTAVGPSGFVTSSGIGGRIGNEIKYAGFDNIIVQGKSDTPVYINIRDDIIEFKDAVHLWGKDPRKTQEIIKDEIGDPETQIMCIGPAGEKLVSFSCILTGMYSAAGHGGYGAIMGSKNLKAIAVRGKKGVKIAKMAEFLNACYVMRNDIMENPVCKAVIDSGGRTTAPEAVRAGLAPMGNLENTLWDESIAKELDAKGNEFWKRYRVSSIGCAGCPMHHYYVFDVPGIGLGAPKCAAWAEFAWPLKNTDYNFMFKVGMLCNEYGIDFTSTARSISFLSELYHRGIITENDTDGIAMRSGDKDAIIAMIHKIGTQEGCGRIFQNGVVGAAEQIGRGAEEFALNIKGVEMFSSELRPFKAMALAYAVLQINVDGMVIMEPGMGKPKEEAEKLALQLCGAREAADLATYKKKGMLVSALEERVGVVELLGVCKWYMLYLTPFLELPVKLYSLATGIDAAEEDLFIAARRMRTLAKAINISRGLTRKDDALPDRLFGNPVSGGIFKGATLDKCEFQKMIDDYYTACGWEKDGIPQESTFHALGLSAEWKTFKRRMSREMQNG